MSNVNSPRRKFGSNSNNKQTLTENYKRQCQKERSTERVRDEYRPERKKTRYQTF
jgi:hypothetical protein